MFISLNIADYGEQKMKTLNSKSQKIKNKRKGSISTTYGVMGRGGNERPQKPAVLKACAQTLMDTHGFQGQGWFLGTMTPAGVLQVQGQCGRIPADIRALHTSHLC